MPLLNRTKSPKAPRVSRPRVYLSREENRQVNRVQPKERRIGWALAAYSAVVATIIHFAEKGTDAGELWKYAVLLVGCAVFALAAWKANRMLLGLAALIPVYLPAVEGTKTSSLFFLPSLPLFVFTMWLILFAINKDRRQMIQERIDRGDMGIDPRTQARLDRSAKKGEAIATSDATGRALAPKSKRYTPPKAKASKK